MAGKVSEEQLLTWAKAPSHTEESKCQNTVSRITEALGGEFGDDVSVFLQGSYKNRTNVKLDSDVDVAVKHDGYYFHDIGGLSEEDKALYKSNWVAGDYAFSAFKNDVQNILANEFGTDFIERKNKCIKVYKNSNRVNADVVPCYEHRRFKTVTQVEAEGIELVTDKGIYVHSFPDQHYENGVIKNDQTSRMYKSLVRILKNVRNKMVDDQTILSELMPSFLLECVVWNAPNDALTKHSYRSATHSVIAQTWEDMRDFDKAIKYAEVSDLKWLFKGEKKWTPKNAEDFMYKAYNHIGYD